MEGWRGDQSLNGDRPGIPFFPSALTLHGSFPAPSCPTIFPSLFCTAQEADSGLLNFGSDEEGQSEDDVSEDDEEEEGEEDDEEAEGDEDDDEAPKDKKKKGTPAGGAEEAVAGLPTKGPLTLSLVQGWTAAALAGPSLGAMRHLAQAYRAACHYGDSDEAGEAGLQIASSALFNRIMLFMLVRARRAWEEG